MTSRKMIIFLLASIVMRNPLLLKMRHIYFLMFSVSFVVAVIASPSSRSTFILRSWSWKSRNV